MRNTGVAVLHVANGVPVVEHATVIVTKPLAKKRHTYQADDDVRCLTEIGDALNALASDYPPDFVVVETDIVGKGARSMKTGGLGVGAVVGWAQSRRLVCIGVRAAEAKHAATGYTNASKDLVATEVVQALGALDADNRGFHVSDAAAVALAGLATQVGRAMTGRAA